MRGIKSACLLVSTLLLGAPAWGAQLVLDYLQVEEMTEDSGDELYFSVTSYHSDKSTDHYQVPTFPTHWMSDHLSDVHDVQLWEAPVGPAESVELIISLTEHDAPPWNIDDLVGTVKVKLANKGGRLVTDWSLFGKQGITKEVEGNPLVREYLMTGDGGRYQIGLHLEE